MSKKPWIWGECRSIVSTRFTPAATSRLATSFAEIGTRERSLRSCRAYAKNGITAVIRFADARRAASVMISSSIRYSFGDIPVGWMMNTSRPRTVSSIRHGNLAIRETA